MSAPNYAACLARVLKYEGGYTNHPSDPGGPTNFGITIHDYRRYIDPNGTANDVRNMKLAQAANIYRQRYWNAVDGDNLHDGVDLAVFDYGVNSGIGRALPDFKPFRPLEPVTAIKGLCARRMRFLKALRTWSVFGAGWGSRVANVEATGVRMALAAQGKPKKEIQGELQKEAEKANKSKQGGVVVGGGAVGGGAATAGKTGVLAQFDWFSICATVALVAGAIWIAWFVVQHYHRQKAYLDAAKAA